MNLRTQGRGQACLFVGSYGSNGSNKSFSTKLAAVIFIGMLASIGCEISIDRASQDAGPDDVAQSEMGADAGHPGTDSSRQLDPSAEPSTEQSATDRPSVDPKTSDAPPNDPLKPAPRNPDSPSSDSVKHDPARPDSSKPDSSKPDSPKPDSPKPEASSPDSRTPESPKPDSPKPVAGPKKELLPIESTARSALAREPGIEVITFDDLNLGMQADMVFRDFLLSERVRELDGQKVRLIGYMHGGVSQLKDLREFVLLRNTECKFGPGGLADHLVRVFVKSEPGAEYSTSAMQIEGILKVNPFQGPDGNTWSVYDIEALAIKVIRK